VLKLVGDFLKYKIHQRGRLRPRQTDPFINCLAQILAGQGFSRPLPTSALGNELLNLGSHQFTSARGPRYVQLPFGTYQKADNVAILSRTKTAYQFGASTWTEKAKAQKADFPVGKLAK